jgi:hypothetical protein
MAEALERGDGSGPRIIALDTGSAATAIVAACGKSAISEPVIVQPSSTRRRRSTMKRVVPGPPGAQNTPPRLPEVSVS